MAIPINSNNLLLLFVCSLLLSLTSAHFSPIDNHLIDCGSGSNEATTLDDGRVFVSDSKSTVSTRLISPGHKISLSNPSPSSLSLPPLYQTARVFTKPSAYEFDIKTEGTHLIRIHFYPFSSQSYDLLSAKFHVTASKFVLLYNFGFEKHGGASTSPQLKEFFLNLGPGKLTIAFVSVGDPSFAFVNAIEVVSAPDDLIGDVARLVNSDKVENFDGITKMAMEMVYRVNVGGPKVTPFNDTLWRDWVPDSEYLMSSDASKLVTFSGRIMYRKNGASREVAPDNVYNSARTSKSNMTWAFAVDPGYKYLVRMHFCDIASLALNELYIDVYVNGYSAYKDLDISDATGQVLASPYYVDFVVGVDRSGLLSVGIGPSKFSDPSKVGGLLNGLEIMKINNTIGSLDGESSVAFVLEKPGVGSFGAFVRSLACGSVFVTLSAILFMLVFRWRAEKKDHFKWSRLPVNVSDSELKGSPLVTSETEHFDDLFLGKNEGARRWWCMHVVVGVWMARTG